MNRDALIERLAEASYRWLSNYEREWNDADSTSKQNYRAVITADFMPLIVEGVADWLDEKYEDGTVDFRPVRLREAWKKEMGQ